MAFKYRLQKVLELREGELEKAKKNFQVANSALKEAQTKIDQNLVTQIEQKKELTQIRDVRIIPLILNRVKFLQQELEELEEEKKKAAEKVEEKRKEMAKAQQKVEILKKHSKKQEKKFREEEERKEQAELNEIALIMRRVREEQNE